MFGDVVLLFSAFLALATLSHAQCGANNPTATVTGSPGSYRVLRGSTQLYAGGDYRLAIQTALDSVSGGQRVSVLAAGNLGANTIAIASGKIFEGCAAINADARAGRGAIESLNTYDVQIPYLTLTGAPYFGMRFHGVQRLRLGQVTMNLSGGMGIRFDRDAASNRDVTMDTIRVTGAGSHAVETWNIDGLRIGQVVARDVGECGLLRQTTTNAWVGLVDGQNVAAGTGYATLRFANRNGRLSSGSYSTNVVVDRVVSRGGGRGIFCVSESGGATIGYADLANNGNNAVLIENCYGVNINGGVVNGGGEVRLAARTEFANNRDIAVALRVDGTTVRESPCGFNIRWNLSGNGARNIC